MTELTTTEYRMLYLSHSFDKSNQKFIFEYLSEIAMTKGIQLINMAETFWTDKWISESDIGDKII